VDRVVATIVGNLAVFGLLKLLRWL
jgi:hypothetical protein